jgi:hypothetical protein
MHVEGAVVSPHPIVAPKSWPSADQESPAGPIQLLSVPPQPVVKAAAPERDEAPPPAPVAPPAEPVEDLGSETRQPVAHILGDLAFGLFELQQPDPAAPVRTLAAARATPGVGRETEGRGGGPRADAFALLGEIDFLDF